MSTRQQEYTLSAVNPNFSNVLSVSLQFNPSEIIVLNNTSNPVYISRGNTQIPSASFYDYRVPAAVNGYPGNVKIPTNSYEFGVFLPLTPTLTDTTATVTIIFKGSLIKFQNFQEFALDVLNTKKK